MIPFFRHRSFVFMIDGPRLKSHLLSLYPFDRRFPGAFEHLWHYLDTSAVYRSALHDQTLFLYLDDSRNLFSISMPL